MTLKNKINIVILSLITAILVMGQFVRIFSLTNPSTEVYAASDENNQNDDEFVTVFNEYLNVGELKIELTTFDIYNANKANNSTITVSQIQVTNVPTTTPIADTNYPKPATGLSYDERVTRVRNYLLRIKAPLAEKAEYLVQIADQVGIDYRLVAAISVIESSGGKKCYRPYNAWGWGGANGYSFNSWEEAIYTVSTGLKRGYYNNGAVTPQSISWRYNPHTPTQWASKVTFVMSQM